ncbi:uncharacterized protein LOC111326679 isoform X2 [Stylophora pistillata]|uniref:THAP-type domain-containing protein n=1 Tax=Stylophora pistillata TaxID=50429 RepID=A0A2B4SH05_STYPI|nr:uncharacterized protein LOC111326679 isoform X2 [Stylophora pistillata]PFX28150.1 hypothetical protein AWC38_SpisGene7126 [Stylophora pistillata]
MGKGDHCAVFGCRNDRRYPERWVVKPHIHCMKWHKPNQKHFKLWEQLINRNNFRVTENTKSDVSITTQTDAIKRDATHTQTSSGKFKKLEVLHEDNEGVLRGQNAEVLLEENSEETTESLASISNALENDHTYCMYEQSGDCKEDFACQARLCLKCKKELLSILEENGRLKNENEQLQKALVEANQAIIERTNRDCVL